MTTTPEGRDRVRIELTGPERVRSSEEWRFRATVVNDSFEPVSLYRNAFVGPNLRPVDPPGMPLPASVEPTYGDEDEPLTLHPFTYFGRERFFSGLPPGRMEMSARYAATDDDEITAFTTVTIEEG